MTALRRSAQQLEIAPLVMHGGSGVSEEDYKQAIAAGIRKINYYTYMNLAAGQALQRAIEEQPKEELFFDEFSLAATAAIKENVAKALRIFNRL